MCSKKKESKSNNSSYVSVWESSTASHSPPLIEIVKKYMADILNTFGLPTNSSWFIRLVTDKPARSTLASLLRQRVISSWKIIPKRDDKPDVECISLDLNSPPTPSGRNFGLQGALGNGVGYTINQAIRPAMAEALERYSLCIWDEEKLKYGSFSDLQHVNAIDPLRFVTFSKEQLKRHFYRRSRLSKTTNLHWVKAASFTETNKLVLVPAQPVYLNFEAEYHDEPLLIHATTNGAAAGISFENALYGAICECIERDALMLAWLHRLPLPRIQLDSLPIQRSRQLVGDIKRKGYEIQIVDITSDLEIPTFCSVLIDRKGSRTVSVSAAADLDPRRALEKVVLEAAKFPFYPITTKKSWETLSSKFEIRSFDDRAQLWSHVQMVKEIDFFLEGEERPFSSLYPGNLSWKSGWNMGHKLDFVKKLLKDFEYDCYVVEVTSVTARDFGLRVVKVLMPELVPLYVSEKDKPLGLNRLLNYSKVSRTASELNQIPHPFL